MCNGLELSNISLYKIDSTNNNKIKKSEKEIKTEEDVIKSSHKNYVQNAINNS